MLPQISQTLHLLCFPDLCHSMLCRKCHKMDVNNMHFGLDHKFKQYCMRCHPSVIWSRACASITEGKSLKVSLVGLCFNMIDNNNTTLSLQMSGASNKAINHQALVCIFLQWVKCFSFIQISIKLYQMGMH